MLMVQLMLCSVWNVAYCGLLHINGSSKLTTYNSYFVLNEVHIYLPMVREISFIRGEVNICLYTRSVILELNVCRTKCMDLCRYN